MSSYHGKFNWKGEVFDMYTTANTEKRAFLSFIGKISKKLNISFRTVLYSFNGEIDNCWITKCKQKMKK